MILAKDAKLAKVKSRRRRSDSRNDAELARGEEELSASLARFMPDPWRLDDLSARSSSSIITLFAGFASLRESVVFDLRVAVHHNGANVFRMPSAFTLSRRSHASLSFAVHPRCWIR